MKSHLHHIALIAALGTTAFAAEPAVKSEAPASFTDALTQGKVSVNARLRYEFVDQDAFADADALTARLRLGYTTKLYKGFQAMVEGEAVTPLVKDYSDSTPPPAPGTNAIVADPEVYNVNQAWVSYTREKTKGTLGRQKLVLDNARFVGDVGWRQNDQTFDAVVIQDKSFDKTTLTYGYLDRINRIFDDSGVQPDWDSNSHVLNASYAGLPVGTLTGYAYLLDFNADNGLGNAGALAASSQTYGLSLVGAKPVTKDLKATYRLEYAIQSDYGDAPVAYDTDYYVVELGGAYKAHSLAFGYEVLGSDINAAPGGVGFKTPLATLHAFNGWADVFLATPGAGLTDTYVKAGTTLPGKVGLTAFYHVFGTTEGAEQLGQEFDVLATYKLNKQLSFTAKAAKFWSDEAGFADRTKFWLQADYAY